MPLLQNTHTIGCFANLQAGLENKTKGNVKHVDIRLTQLVTMTGKYLGSKYSCTFSEPLQKVRAYASSCLYIE